MKTAISIPNAVFERVERKVKAMGLSRSEFFSRAAIRYLGELDGEDLTARIDAALDAGGIRAVGEQAELAQIGLASLDVVSSNAPGGDDW
jgi:hypothetical protein